MNELRELLDALEDMEKTHGSNQAETNYYFTIVRRLYRAYKAAPEPLVLEAVDAFTQDNPLITRRMYTYKGQCYRLPGEPGS